jgi:hypothetical protein
MPKKSIFDASPPTCIAYKQRELAVRESGEHVKAKRARYLVKGVDF